MSSHSSSGPAFRAVTGAVPIQGRGRARVAGILDAARRLFLADGYDAVTMTAIAAASGTAIGSLYRFFPTKEHVADGLLARYAERLGAEFAEMLPQVRTVDAAGLADALVDQMTDRGGSGDRDLSLVLLDSLPDRLARQLRIRGEVFAGLHAVLSAVSGRGVDPAMTGAVLQVLKTLSEAGRYAALPGPDAQAVIAETRFLLAAYLEKRLGGLPVTCPTDRR